MASVHLRRGGEKVYVYYYDTKAGEQVQIPRDQTEHLDGQPPEVVQAWVTKWEADHGKQKAQIERLKLGPNDKLTKLWNSYQTHWKRFKKRNHNTEKAETGQFERYVCRFFVTKHRNKNPSTWHALVPQFHDWLFDQPLVDATRRDILWALERFGKYLVFQRIMTFPFVIQTPSTENVKVTPLKVRIRPEDVLELVKIQDFQRARKKYANRRTGKLNFKLAILISYFASLEPEALWALDREDFLTGVDAVTKSKTYAGFHALRLDGKQAAETDGPEKRLGSRLAVRLQKSIIGGTVQPMLKNDYRFGRVTIWHPEGAKLIAALLKEMPPGRLFPFTRGYSDRKWKEIVKPLLGATVHDLRRASCLYLGRTIRVPATLLQEHMRHAELDTTLLYMREPLVEEPEKDVAPQDLDDVI